VSLLDSSGAGYCAITGTDAVVDKTLTSTVSSSTSDVIRIATGNDTDAKVEIDASASCAAAGVNKVTLTTSN
jgi:hypothetical protein